MDSEQARRDIAFVSDVLRRTNERVDPHLFHFVHWGGIVLFWYPVSNYLQSRERLKWVVVVGAVSVALGMLLSALRERRIQRHPRLPGANTFISTQLAFVTAGNIGVGFLLSWLAPALGLIDGRNVPILWGLIYANLTFTTGVVYEREFLWAAVAILVGVVLAIVFQDHAGYILGPFMGLGMIVPGLRAEERVRRMVQEREVEPERV